MKQYDPKSVTISWLGVNLSEGIAEGTFVTVSQDERDWTITSGSDGEVIRTRTNKTTGVIEVTLLQGSAANAALDSILHADKLSGAVVGGVLVKDNQSSATKAVGVNAFLEGPPDLVRGDTPSNVVWRFLCEKVEIFNRGNAPVQAEG